MGARNSRVHVIQPRVVNVQLAIAVYIFDLSHCRLAKLLFSSYLWVIHAIIMSKVVASDLAIIPTKETELSLLVLE